MLVNVKFFKKIFLISFFLLLTTNLSANEKDQIIAQLNTLNSLEFTFNQLINESNTRSAELAFSGVQGEIKKKIDDIKNSLINQLCEIEARVDFEEDFTDFDYTKYLKKIKKVKEKIELLIENAKRNSYIHNGISIALIGKTNVGKSSLLNLLAKKEKAIVTNIPGTTRDVIEAHLNLDGYPVVISDTAGIRESKDEIEKKGIKLSLNRAEEADLKLVVVDAKSLDFTDVLKGLLDENAILVINKSDLLEKDIDPEIKKTNHVLISIKENKNIEELILKIKNNLKNKFLTSDDILITRERHRQHLQQCLDHLNNFNQKKEIEDFDKAAEDLRLATRHLGMIVGKVDVEEILGSIFNDFCIGK